MRHHIAPQTRKYLGDSLYKPGQPCFVIPYELFYLHMGNKPAPGKLISQTLDLAGPQSKVDKRNALFEVFCVCWNLELWYLAAFFRGSLEMNILDMKQSGKLSNPGKVLCIRMCTLESPASAAACSRS